MVICTETHSIFGEGLEYELIMEHPTRYAIFDNNGKYRLVEKDKFELI